MLAKRPTNARAKENPTQEASTGAITSKTKSKTRSQTSKASRAASKDKTQAAKGGAVRKDKTRIHKESSPKDTADNNAQVNENGDRKVLLSGPADALGQAMALMMQSPMHRHMFLADMEWLVLPPIALQQFRIFRNKGVPTAYVSWARLTEEAEKRIMQGQLRLKPNEWNAGDRIWLVDVVAPYGNADEVFAYLSSKLFKNRNVKTFAMSQSSEKFTEITL